MTMERKLKEPETLKRHREMYKRRLEEFKWRRGLSDKQMVDLANNPSSLHEHSQRS